MSSSDYVLPDGDGFESISSTDLIIKSSPSNHSNNHSTQKSISQTTRAVSSLATKKQQKPSQQKPSQPKSKVAGREKERRNSFTKRQERGNASGQTYREQQHMFTRNSDSDGNELKNVFAKLQNKSVAQKLREHLEEEEAEQARPAKEDRGEDNNMDAGNDAESSSSALKSEF